MPYLNSNYFHHPENTECVELKENADITKASRLETGRYVAYKYSLYFLFFVCEKLHFSNTRKGRISAPLVKKKTLFFTRGRLFSRQFSNKKTKKTKKKTIFFEVLIF